MPVLVDRFFAARRSLKDSPHTTAAYRRDLAAIIAIVRDVTGTAEGGLVAEDLTVAALREAFGVFAGTHAKTSIVRCWSTWNQFFTFLVGDGVLPGNPMPAVPRPRPARAAPKPLRGEDTPETLLRSAAAPRANARRPWPERDLAVLATLLLTGLRSAELLSLTVGSLTGLPGERRIHVVGKGGAARSVPIEDALDTVIEAYLGSRRARFPGRRVGDRSPLFVDAAGAPLRRGGLQYLVQTTMRAAGLADRRSPGALVHAFRHTYATRLADDGATASEIMALLGHASLSTSQSYIDATAIEQRRSAAANRTYRALTAMTGRDGPPAGPA
ncbi:MAG: Phage integrase family protein [uncultured Corynebacteriales bacterium]|uniref:Phage integrase family protein n=1 Tax=uncultured Mycobacteriales bacterium TaxID=581187 RepID=A0A6J4H5Z0_9ACTN|nr:MAG: Phage integrase family protein [uncultured Corynebacteriales bacterium]